MRFYNSTHMSYCTYSRTPLEGMYTFHLVFPKFYQARVNALTEKERKLKLGKYRIHFSHGTCLVANRDSGRMMIVYLCNEGNYIGTGSYPFQ